MSEWEEYRALNHVEISQLRKTYPEIKQEESNRSFVYIKIFTGKVVIELDENIVIPRSEFGKGMGRKRLRRFLARLKADPKAKKTRRRTRTLEGSHLRNAMTQISVHQCCDKCKIQERNRLDHSLILLRRSQCRPHYNTACWTYSK
ncbi:hypothetical protein CABS01_16844 [Colletotrichum abscissum]|uniref:uncharacterized protein n=1 Tax=Colletotrichum abscissum TaxID=1671311 RepID=UPI0027D6CB34|nr:uncharacterized protein CABS01_16844 [Colletotrichum abscissum]KAK1509305.1 hypothetical protein CABS01_16844 [Colletotrichum abscissum]